jgi:hypothetical protein
MPQIHDSITQDSIIADTVIIGEESNRVQCNNCKTEGNITFFICSDSGCESTYCEYCESKSRKLCKFHYMELNEKMREEERARGEIKREKEKAREEINNQIRLKQGDIIQNILLGLLIFFVWGLLSEWFWIRTIIPTENFVCFLSIYYVAIFVIIYRICDYSLDKFRY